MAGYMLYYFILYMCFQLYGVFAVLYYSDSGCSDTQVGIIKGVGQFVFIFSMLIFGKLADKVKDKHLLSFITLILSAASLAVTPFIKNFYWMLLCASLYFLFNCNQQLADVIALDYSRTSGADFGKLRMFGGIGAVVACLCVGYIVGERYEMIFYMAAAVCVISGTIALFLPRGKKAAPPLATALPAEKEGGAEAEKQDVSLKALFSNKTATLLIILTLLMFIATSCHGTFFALRISDVGGDVKLISYAMLIQSVCGLPFMFFSSKIRRKIGDKALMIISCIIYILVFTLSAVLTSPVALVVINLLYLFSGGMSYCITVKMAEILPPGLLARGQMFIGIAGYGVAMSFGAVMGGIISDTLGSTFSFLLCAAFMAIPLIILVVVSILNAKGKGIKL